MQVKRMPVTRRRCNGYFFALKSPRLLSCRDVLAWHGHAGPGILARHGTDSSGKEMAGTAPRKTHLPDPNLGPGPQIASCLSDCLRLPYGNLTVTKGLPFGIFVGRLVRATFTQSCSHSYFCLRQVCFAYAQVGRELGSLTFNDTLRAN